MSSAARTASLCLVLFCLAPGFPRAYAAEDGAITLECGDFQYVIDATGHNRAFIDKTTGANYCTDGGPAAIVTEGGKEHAASAASLRGGLLHFRFDGTDARAVVRVLAHSRHLVLEVVSVAGDGVEAFVFLNVNLNLTATLSDSFAACALALDLQTNVSEIPGPNKLLKATCYERFGFEGAEVAVVGAPLAELRNAMKEAVSAAEELPKTDIGGPWAFDSDISRGSYLFDFGQCTEETVDDWVALVKQLGLKQVDFHTGKSLRFGDCRPNPDLFPNGRASVKAMIDRLHDAGIKAGLHTYAFFIAKDTPYVTPVPDKRLGKFRSFTLAADISADADTIQVDESTADVSLITSFFSRNSVTLHIDDELVTFTGVTKEAPFTFTGCKRGACGTTPAAHTAGAKAHHLKECFGLFTPGADTTLLAEVAHNTADTYNECGFDMMYLDALDGEDILAGRENGWHYGSKFVFEIANRINKPALFEMSTFHHHLWYVRARMGAWDHPSRAHKTFIDIHCEANQAGGRMFLPMNLGWWAVKTWSSPRNEPTYPDDIEYLLCKALGNDFSLSLMGVNPGNFGDTPAYQRLAPLFKNYEELRLADYFPGSVREQLREPGAEFTLEQTSEGAWQLRRVQHAKHRVQGLDGWSNAWQVANPYPKQPVRLRIAALMSVEPYDSPNGVVLEDFADPAVFNQRPALAGIEGDLAAVTDVVKTGDRSGLLAAKNGQAAPKSTWMQIGRNYDPPFNAGGKEGLGVWVHGDGKGEVLNIQLKSPEHIARGISDHFIDIDFTGWRYFSLVEMDSARTRDYGLPYRNSYYALYREDISYGSINALSLWYTNLPKDASVACHISPIKALPLKECVVRNPRVTIGGQSIMFPVAIPTGSYLEFVSMDNCKLYGKSGELIAEVKPQGQAPVVAEGANTIEFTCEAQEGTVPRAYVTVTTLGEALTP